MSVREGIEFETVLESDTAALNGLTEAMLQACPNIRCMRDPTRGGISSALNELAGAARVGIRLNESAIPIRPEVHAACEMLGLDPLYVANEGKLIAVVPRAEVERVMEVMRGHPLGQNAAHDWRGRGRTPGAGLATIARGRRTRCDFAGGRATAEDLLAAARHSMSADLQETPNPEVEPKKPSRQILITKCRGSDALIGPPARFLLLASRAGWEK